VVGKVLLISMLRRDNLIGAEVGTTIKKDQIEQTRYSRLQVVVKYIEKQKDRKIGTVDAPETFFKGTLPMHWGPLTEKIVYFAGSTEQTILGLGGSLHHVIGSNVGAGGVGGSSMPFEMMTSLIKGLRLQEPYTDEFFDPEAALVTVESLFGDRRGPGQQLEFLATKYLSGPSQLAEQGGPTQVLLGSPIYVALAV
jgi:hypothetical protein